MKPFTLAFALLGSIVVSVFSAAGCTATCEDKGTCGPFSPTGGSAGNAAGASGRGGTAGKAGAPGGTAGTSLGGTAGQGGESGMGASGAGEAGTSSGKAGKGGTAGTATGGAGGEAGDQGGAGQGGSEPCDGDCKGETPICVTATNQCVQCTAENSSECEDDTPVCDTEANECVACLTSDDCPLTTAARCDEGHACVACSSADDCAHLSGTNVCDSGTCVQCTSANESACGVNSCNPATHECTDTPRGSVGTCEPCLADSECTGGDQSDPDRRCVPMTFQGVERAGGFCLKRFAKTCTRPFTIPFSAISLSGLPAENYCGIDQETVRCEAVLDLTNSRQCADGLDTSCGCARDEDDNCLEAGKGGICGVVNLLPNRCTYGCGTLDQCPGGLACGEDYCE
jgi:hypothetical protein